MNQFPKLILPPFISVLLLLLPANVFAQVTPKKADIFIRVNQVGYRPTDPKTAVVMSKAPLGEKFQVVEKASQRVVFEGPPRSIDQTWGQFSHHSELDFSALDKDGEYFLRVAGVESPSFPIRANVYAELPDQLLEFMRQQQCGYNPWVDAVCHSFDGRTADGLLPAGTYVDARGGWHDAGDQLKYLLTASNATAQMLLAYQMGQQPTDAHISGAPQFSDRVNELGQPFANGVPDLLDEARWGLDWMLRLHPAPDQLYHQVADDRDHKNFRLPQEETVDYGWGPGSYRVVYSADGKPQGLKQYKSESDGIANLAGRYAAAMALGYQIWKDDARLAAYAAHLLQAGKEVYAMGKAKEGVQQGNSYGAPYRYAETTWADDMEWGAAELLRATGDSQYRADAERYAKLTTTTSWMGQETAGHYQFYPFMNAGHFRLYDQVDEPMRATLAGYYREQIERCVAAGGKNPYRVGVPFIWCSNNLTVALATQCGMYERMTGDRQFREFTAQQRDWLVGRNPWGMSMFTDIPAGGRFPRDVHLFPNALQRRSVRGALVDGPVARKIFQSLKGVTITEPDPFAAFQDERAVYHDDIQDYSSNEPTVDGTASAILMWVVLGTE